MPEVVAARAKLNADVSGVRLPVEPSARVWTTAAQDGTKERMFRRTRETPKRRRIQMKL